MDSTIIDANFFSDATDYVISREVVKAKKLTANTLFTLPDESQHMSSKDLWFIQYSDNSVEYREEDVFLFHYHPILEHDIILVSPDGTRFKLKVANNGQLSTDPVV